MGAGPIGQAKRSWLVQRRKSLHDRTHPQTVARDAAPTSRSTSDPSAGAVSAPLRGRAVPLVLLVDLGACLRLVADFLGLPLDPPQHYALVATTMRDRHPGAEP
ncbi:hypothetical protein JL100_017530 [Skermanella mucosa]|uniref:hypothetical protein n=1 Tax=Skermanella mucosa TaxID=1789672 RepID=UPI00192BD86E|nr:hypothetical protein [Skermanella mucosa]UEM18892.1 hypothetical protein JL100_017530 [Skermanella mucosa]